MGLRLDDRWIWDFWVVRDGGDHHLFFLQAPRSLGDPALRHIHATIGHAISPNLRSWALLPDALGPGATRAWDERAPWTGSVVRHRGCWHLFYTSTTDAEEGLVQRIGAATSDDLVHWERHPANPLLVADPRWYERLDPGAWFDQAWRDPWLFRDPVGQDVHAFITARSAAGPPDGRGVVAHARSTDLVRWEIGPPVFAPGEFGELEVPQVVVVDGRWFLLFSVPASSHGQRWRRRTGQVPRTAVYYVSADHPLGPFHGPPQRLVAAAGEPREVLYAAKLVDDGTGRWVLLATRLFGPDGAFAGDLIDPLPVTVDPAGALVVGGRDDR